MNTYEKFINFLSTEMPRQQAPYMPFHIIMLVLVFATTIFLCVKFKNCSDRTFRKIIFIIWVILFVFEIYKQMVAPFSVVDGKAVWYYNYNDIPYQFCSTIHYVLLPIAFMKDGKLRNGLMMFVMTYIFVAGFGATVYADQLKSDMAIGICVQTMVHHGLQVVAGAFIAVRMRDKLCLKDFLYGMAVFAFFLVIAIILDVVLKPGVVNNGAINFFYISPYHKCPLPILTDLKELMPWSVFVLGYFVFFTLGGLIVYLIGVGIKKAYRKKKLKNS